MTNPTFTALYHGDYTALRCRENGTRYIVSNLHGNDCGAYREGHLIFTGPRTAAINAVESDARWSIRLDTPLTAMFQ